MEASACTECGNPLRDGARFCPACGSVVLAEGSADRGDPSAPTASVMSPPPVPTCAACGHTVREGAQFCPACGSNVAAAAAPAALVSSVISTAEDAEVAPPVESVTLAPPPPPADPQVIVAPTAAPAVTAPLLPPTPPSTAAPAMAPPGRPPVSSSSSGRGRGPFGDRRILAAAGGLLVLVIAVVLVVALGGGGSKHGQTASVNTVAHVTSTVAPPASATTKSQAPAAVSTATTETSTTTATSTGTTTGSNTVAQVAGLEAILSLAATGRQALANGNITATIANRRLVLAQLNTFQADTQLAPSVAALKAAETFSLHADTTCGLNCPAAINQNSTNLKTAFLAMFNPIATQYGARTYSPGEI
jgi:RNA polymerase subunit RPABC4/transcription elongation factor Spt4